MAILPPRPDNFDSLSTVAEPVPAGMYEVICSGASYGPSKNNDDVDMLRLEFTIQDEEYAGRKLFANLCLVHPKQQVQNIAWAQFKQACEAMALDPDTTDDPTEFIGSKCDVTVSIQTPTAEQVAKGYGPSNSIRRFS